MIRRMADQIPDSPKSLGYRLPAEWEPHEATWLAWPHNRSDWPGKFSSIQWVYADIVRRVAPGEIVRIVVNSAIEESRARRVLNRVGVDLSGVEFFRLPTNRSWIRDYGPAFIVRDPPEPGLAVSRFRFRGWAKYPDWELDDRVPKLLARALGLRLFEPVLGGGRGFVLEGGAIETNGRGTLITTEECLLDRAVQPRNPGLERADVESVLRGYLGATNIVWLPFGIAGDDTHGHIDDVCRFVNHRTLVVASQSEVRDENFSRLRANIERLREMRLEDGSRPEIVVLPMPEPLYFDGKRLPASYANFYISNTSVLVPTFNDPRDRVALGVLSDLFPDRIVVGIHSVDLVWGLGAVHCLTREQPALGRAYEAC